MPISNKEQIIGSSWNHGSEQPKCLGTKILRLVDDDGARLLDACAQGSAVLLISEDLDEVFALADRVAVMRAGRIEEQGACADVLQRLAESRASVFPLVPSIASALVAMESLTPGFLPDVRILVFHGVLAGEEFAFAAHRLIPVLNSLQQIARWKQVAAEHVHAVSALHIDTAMARMGLSMHHTQQAMRLLASTRPVDGLTAREWLLSPEDVDAAAAMYRATGGGR
mgnify:CR=1 FL=1